MGNCFDDCSIKYGTSMFSFLLFLLNLTAKINLRFTSAATLVCINWFLSPAIVQKYGLLYCKLKPVPSIATRLASLLLTILEIIISRNVCFTLKANLFIVVKWIALAKCSSSCNSSRNEGMSLNAFPSNCISTWITMCCSLENTLLFFLLKLLGIREALTPDLTLWISFLYLFSFFILATSLTFNSIRWLFHIKLSTR